MEVLAKAPKTSYQEKGTYIKRKHNDPINLPSLLQKKDIAGDFRSGIAFECGVGQADGTDQVSPLCKVFPYGGVTSRC